MSLAEPPSAYASPSPDDHHVSRARWRGELLSTAAEALARYKLRTALSVLGVVLGVAAVIAMMSVIEGARREALAQVEQMGLDNLVVRNRGVAGGQAAGMSGLTAGDAQRVLGLVPLAEAASPLVDRYLPVSHAGNRMMTRVLGVGAAYQTILRLRLERGRFLSTVDERKASRVCVLGGSLARMLFGYRDPIGETVRLDADYYEVVGVLSTQRADPQTLGALAWRDVNQAVFAPVGAVLGRTLDVAPSQRVDELWLRIRDGERVEAVGQVLEHTLARLHGAADVDITIPRELLAQRYRTQQTFGVVIGSIAVIALVVGGIGIMNIMLTSVVERTREIGIRRTVGATRRDVKMQFLTESLLMTVSGGALGIVIGVAISWGITAYAGWSTYISAQAVLLALAVSFAVGLGFGLYPAVLAARLEPVDAMRHE